jgi:hypothetical protein
MSRKKITPEMSLSVTWKRKSVNKKAAGKNTGSKSYEN